MGAQVSREPPPPLPGGYVVGEQVYYTGASKAFRHGDRLEHGKQGEVVGPATSENQKGKGVKVQFVGNTDAISCYLAQVCRYPAHRTHSATALGSAWTRTGKPRAATATAGRLHGGRAGLLHGGG